MGREMVVSGINWKEGIPSAMRGVAYYVLDAVKGKGTGSVVLPITELVGTTIDKLKAQPYARIKELGNLVEFYGPLRLTAPPDRIQLFLAKSMLAGFVAFLAVSIASTAFSKEELKKSEWTAKKVAAVAVSCLAGFATFYFLGTTRMCQTNVEFFPADTTFVKSWWWSVQVTPPPNKSSYTLS